MTREEKSSKYQKDIDIITSREERKKIVLLVLKLLFFIILLFILFYFFTTYVSNSLVIVKENRITNKKIPDEFNSVKIIQFSDLLYGSNISNKEVKKVVDIINERKPDLVLFTGNLLDEDYEISNKNQEKLINYLNSIDDTIGKYSVLGSYDVEEKFRTIMNQSGFIILSNSSEKIYNNGDEYIKLVGLDSLVNEMRDIDEAFSDNDNNTYTITIMNETGDISDVLKKKPDLVLAGGNLNGTIRFPLVGGIIKNKGSRVYTDPHYKKNNTDIYISSGIGTNEIGIRFNNQPSINLFRLEKNS